MPHELACLAGLGQVLALVSWYLKLLVAVLLSALLLSFVSSPRLRFYVCYSVYVVTVSVVCVVYIPILLLKSNDSTNIILLRPIALLLTWLLGIRFELRGSQHLAHDQAAVVTLTHQSILDLIGIAKFGPIIQKASGVAKKEVFYFWPLGLTMWISKVIIFIDRKKGRDSNVKLMQSIQNLKEHRMKLLIFPEGTRNMRGEKLLPFKKGAFRIAIEAQIPIIPVVFSPYYFIDMEKKTFNKGTVIMSALSPISTKGKTIADMEELLEKTQALMEQEYQQLKVEVEKTKNNDSLRREN